MQIELTCTKEILEVSKIFTSSENPTVEWKKNQGKYKYHSGSFCFQIYPEDSHHAIC